MPDQTSSAVKTGSVQVKYADGTEHTLPIHGITQLQLIRLADELGIKSLDELKATEPTLQMIRFMTHAAAQALTFEKIQDVWNLKRLEESFADMEQVCKVFLACVNLSTFPRGSKPESQTRKQTPYH